MEKKALGKGLGALLPGREEEEKHEEHHNVISIDVHHVLAGRHQPRKDFGEEELQQLAASLKQTGVLQPIVVRRKGYCFYELIDGERRWRAAKVAGFKNIPATVRNCSDDQAMVLALVENLQRHDLNPMETARAYQRLATEFGMTQEDISQQLGKDRSTVANLARLVHLPNEIQQLIQTGAISTGHAKVLLALNGPDTQVRLARRIAEGQLSVRETEKVVQRELNNRKVVRKKLSANPYPDLVERIQKRVGTKVTIEESGRKGGRVVIHYFSPPDLERVLDVLLT